MQGQILFSLDRVTYYVDDSVLDHRGHHHRLEFAATRVGQVASRPSDESTQGTLETNLFICAFKRSLPTQCAGLPAGHENGGLDHHRPRGLVCTAVSTAMLLIAEVRCAEHQAFEREAVQTLLKAGREDKPGGLFFDRKRLGRRPNLHWPRGEKDHESITQIGDKTLK
ncbi:MAG: hypothetical protein N838_06770 [Thiohalocapsa sp. PB-PSB1]|nr:MAG: hypothetical protein N838_06770 [Thiohalocapsa sp. PB-PSB1]